MGSLPDLEFKGANLNITPLTTDADATACAQMMSGTDPWITLGRKYEHALAVIRDPTREVWVAHEGDTLVGFLILCLTGAFVGYIQSVCVAPERRGQGVGTQLMGFAEARILEHHPNVFTCVSSFNTDARRLYERLGYRVVGEFSDYIVAGHSEILLRKTTGPLT
jgi:ribosomal protein S18 acetylase RimI-like enzyme